MGLNGGTKEKVHNFLGFLYSRQMLTLKGYLRLNVAKQVNGLGKSRGPSEYMASSPLFQRLLRVGRTPEFLEALVWVYMTGTRWSCIPSIHSINQE